MGVSLFLAGGPAGVVRAQDLEIDIKRMSIEELARIDVVSLSRKTETLQDASAAVYILSGEDIRRSGVMSIPEALRLVPGVEVARIDANKWAVSIRGFNSRVANKLLVLIDGRNVYDPLFAGVFWESRDVFLQDVARIEVIRGPGGSLWGANAVNGVINIVTKPAGETQGGYVEAGAGTEERGFTRLRYGFKMADDLHMRVYGKYYRRDAGFNRGEAYDDSQAGLLGFRLDGALGSRRYHTWTFQGDVYDGEAGESIPPDSSRDARHTGGNAMVQWRYSRHDVTSLSIKVYYDHAQLDHSTLDERRNTLDFDFQHRFRIARRQEVVWGLGYRYSVDDITVHSVFQLVPLSRADNLFSGFVQDEIGFFDERVRLTVGSKVEHSGYSGLEIQPSVRMAWAPTPFHTLWASVSRAVRTPSRLETDLVFEGIRFGRGLDSEVLTAYELGYRTQPGPKLFVDGALYYNLYDRLFTNEETLFANNMSGTTYGVEGAVRWQVRPWWRMEGAYTFLEMDLNVTANSTYDAGARTIEGNNPHHQAVLRSSMELFRQLVVDVGVRYVDRLPIVDVPAYLAADLRVAWRPGPRFEIALVGQNLLDPRHPEQRGSSVTEVERSLYGAISWEF